MKHLPQSALLLALTLSAACTISCTVKVSDDVKHFDRRPISASRDPQGLLILRLPIEGWNKVNNGPYELNVVGDWKGQRRGFEIHWDDNQVEWVAKLIYSESFVRALAQELGEPERKGKPLDRILLVGKKNSGPPKELDLPGFRISVDLQQGWMEWQEKDPKLRPAWIASFY
jgi:hypothetical protein